MTGLWAVLIIICCSTTAATAQESIARYGQDNAGRRIIVRGTTDIAVFGPVITAFLETRDELAIDYEQWGSNDLFALSAADCDAGRSGADLIISSGVHQMVKLVNDSCARPHRSDATAALPPELRWRDELWGITSEPVVIVYNRDLIAADEIPRSRFDLLDLLRPAESRYAGRVATYDIETSGLGFLLAMVDSQEATTFGGLLESLGRTGAVVTCCSAEIIDGVADGTYLLAYNVLGSYALLRAAEDDRIGVISPSDYTLLLSRAAMIPDRSEHPGEAAAFLDFMLSSAGRAVLRDVLLIASTEGDAEEEPWEKGAERILRPIGLSPTLLVAMDRQKRETFIRRWRETFPEEDKSQATIAPE